MGLEADVVDELWERYLRLRAVADREALVERYTPFAHMLAAKAFGDRQIREIEFDEFRQYAMVGLVECLDRFDPGYGASFRTYAGHRIRGAILNGIEKYNEKQQQIAARSRLRDERFKSLLEGATQEQPDPFMQLVEFAIGTAIGFMLEDSNMYVQESAAYEHNVYQSRELADLTRVLSGLLDTLPEREREVMREHYFNHRRFDDIAISLDLSKGRISQIHHRALRRLREHYEQLRVIRTDY